MAPSVHRPDADGTQAHLVNMYTIIPDRLSMCKISSNSVAKALIETYPEKFFLSSRKQESYIPFCHDFGPVDLATVHEFHTFFKEFFFNPRIVDTNRELVYYTKPDPSYLTNACFLLASFLVLELKYTPEAAWAPFEKLPRGDIAEFRDATFTPPDYGLSVLSCLQGLHKGIECGWYSPDIFDMDKYLHLQDPRHTGMTFITPKLVASQAPVGAKRREEMAAQNYGSTLPSTYVKAFEGNFINAVVRLNEPTYYDSKEFEGRGIAHHDLYFDDCTTPSCEIINKFLHIVEQTPGSVMVHCRAGLGRTGTLIAIHMMKHHDFSATECIGWLRIVRPGSVLGPQQQFLHEAERMYRRSNFKTKAIPPVLSHVSPLYSFSVNSGHSSNSSLSEVDSLPSVDKSSHSEDMGENIAQAQQRRAMKLDSISPNCTNDKQVVPNALKARKINPLTSTEVNQQGPVSKPVLLPHVQQNSSNHRTRAKSAEPARKSFKTHSISTDGLKDKSGKHTTRSVSQNTPSLAPTRVKTTPVAHDEPSPPHTPHSSSPITPLAQQSPLASNETRLLKGCKASAGDYLLPKSRGFAGFSLSRFVFRSS